MVPFNRFVGWCLVGLVGLISFDASAVTVIARANYNSQVLARSACVDAALNVSANFPQTSNAAYGQYSSDFQLELSCETVLPSGLSTGFVHSYQCGFSYMYKATATSTPYKRYGTCGLPTATSWAVNCSSTGGVTCDPRVYAYQFQTLDPNLCSGKPEYTSRTLRAPTPSGTGSVCHEGCVASVSVGYFGGKYPNGYLEFAFNYNGNVCNGEPQPISEPLIQDADGDGKDDGTDPCPNDPSDTCNIPDDTKDTDGDGVPDHKDPYPNDPNDGKDDGSGDETDNTASGGGTCVTPPSCGGDAIQCNQLFQLWSIRCGKGEGTAQEPGSGTDGNGGEGTDVKGIEDRLDQLHEDNENIFADPDAVISTDGIHQSVEYTADDLDGSGMGFPRSCNFQPISVPVGAGSVQINFGSSGACEIFNWTGLLVVGLASFLGCFILIRV